jgi:hypothetical protein
MYLALANRLASSAFCPRPAAIDGSTFWPGTIGLAVIVSSGETMAKPSVAGTG